MTSSSAVFAVCVLAVPAAAEGFLATGHGKHAAAWQRPMLRSAASASKMLGVCGQSLDRLHGANQRRPNQLRCLQMLKHGSPIVTYGDIWRTAVDEPLLLSSNQTFDESSSDLGLVIDSLDLDTVTGPSSKPKDASSFQAVVRPVAQAATVVGAVAGNIWTSLTAGPSDEEVDTPSPSFFFHLQQARAPRSTNIPCTTRARCGTSP